MSVGVNNIDLYLPSFLSLSLPILTRPLTSTYLPTCLSFFLPWVQFGVKSGGWEMEPHFWQREG